MADRASTSLFSSSDLDRIMSAVREAERGTSGEIVPFVVRGSDSYNGAIWRFAALAMTASLLTLGTIAVVADTWLMLGVAMAAVIVLAIGLIAWIAAALIPPLRVFITPRETITRRVAQRAAQAFIAEEIFATHDRVGILIFISLLEHRVVVLGDTGIGAHVRQEEWDGIVRTIVDGIRSGRPVDGVIEAIEACGRLLRERGLAIGPDDVNELPDRLRTE